MTHDCSKATKLCLWRRNDFIGSTDKTLKWCFKSMEPTWYCVCGIPWYELKTEDEIDINKSCKIDNLGSQQTPIPLG
jgi:hypothetical protein